MASGQARQASGSACTISDGAVWAYQAASPGSQHPHVSSLNGPGEVKPHQPTGEKEEGEERGMKGKRKREREMRKMERTYPTTYRVF